MSNDSNRQYLDRILKAAASIRAAGLVPFAAKLELRVDAADLGLAFDQHDRAELEAAGVVSIRTGLTGIEDYGECFECDGREVTIGFLAVPPGAK